jgi:hypothetical protein
MGLCGKQANPHIHGCKAECERFVCTTLVGSTGGTKPLTVERIRHCERRQSHERKWQDHVEVKGKIEQVEGPRLSPVQVRSTGRIREDVVLDDVPRRDGQPSIEERIDGDHRDLRRH